MTASHRTARLTRVLSALIGALMLDGAPAYAANCGDTIGPGGTVTLQADVICTGISALRVVGPVTLDLNGHTVACGDFDHTGSLSTIGIQVEGVQAQIINGTVANCDFGMRLMREGSTHTLRGLTIQGNRTGVDVSASASNISHSAFSQNVHGLALASARNTVTDNTAIGNTGSAFLLLDHANSNRLLGNTARKNDTGFHVIRGDDIGDNLFSGNVAAKNASAGFRMGGPHQTIVGNRANANGSHGFWLEGQNAVLSGNTAKRNGGDGVRFGRYGHIVEGNVVANNLGSGIAVRQFSNVASTIAFNTVSGHAAPEFDLFDPQFNCINPSGVAMLWKDNVFQTKSGICIP